MPNVTLSEAVSLARARIVFCESEIDRLTKFIEMAGGLIESVAPPASSTAKILQQSEDILARRGSPQSKAAIYEELVMRGIRIPGRMPRGNLTAKFATRKDIFRYDPKTSLWSLVRWDS